MRQLKITKQITNRESQSLDKYLQEIGKLPMISADEEAELARKIREGDQVALEKLTRANLRFVVSVAKQYQSGALTLNDLISEGNVGLIKAAQRFDETRGFKFISYAVWWIRQSIILALSEQSRMIRLPVNRTGSFNKLTRAFADLEQKYQREPTAEELAEALDLSTNEVKLTQQMNRKHWSLDAPFAEGEANSLIDTLENKDGAEADSKLMTDSLHAEIKFCLSQLPDREAEIMALYYGIGGHNKLTLDEIGRRFDLTRERVRQIKDTATKRLRGNSRSSVLKTYL